VPLSCFYCCAEFFKEAIAADEIGHHDVARNKYIQSVELYLMGYRYDHDKSRRCVVEFVHCGMEGA
jgi:hypothetical protein